eukprot:COSAG01_NODE_10084_length_2253_cov_2.121170_4_plen_119_part_00
MSLRVLLFVPNLIGYLRLLLIVAAFHVPGVFDQQVGCYPARLRHRSSLCPRQPASQLARPSQLHRTSPAAWREGWLTCEVRAQPWVFLGLCECAMAAHASRDTHVWRLAAAAAPAPCV